MTSLAERIRGNKKLKNLKLFGVRPDDKPVGPAKQGQPGFERQQAHKAKRGIKKEKQMGEAFDDTLTRLVISTLSERVKANKKAKDDWEAEEGHFHKIEGKQSTGHDLYPTMTPGQISRWHRNNDREDIKAKNKPGKFAKAFQKKNEAYDMKKLSGAFDLLKMSPDKTGMESRVKKQRAKEVRAEKQKKDFNSGKFKKNESFELSIVETVARRILSDIDEARGFGQTRKGDAPYTFKQTQNNIGAAVKDDGGSDDDVSHAKKQYSAIHRANRGFKADSTVPVNRKRSAAANDAIRTQSKATVDAIKSKHGVTGKGKGAIRRAILEPKTSAAKADAAAKQTYGKGGNSSAPLKPDQINKMGIGGKPDKEASFAAKVAKAEKASTDPQGDRRKMLAQKLATMRKPK